jgi:hypothetical protein
LVPPGRRSGRASNCSCWVNALLPTRDACPACIAQSEAPSKRHIWALF